MREILADPLPDAATIAEEAYVLAYPLVLLSRVVARATAVGAPDPTTMRAPVNTLVHRRDTPDTLRSSGWLDLTAEPIVLSVPDTRGRYYALWLRDAWNAVFASIGARTTGTGSHAFAVLGPRDHGARLPAGVTAVPAPTRWVHVGGCIESVGEPDEEALTRAGTGFALAPLSRAGGAWGPPSPAPVAPGDDPVAEVERMDAVAFFAAAERLAAENLLDRDCGAALARLRDLERWDTPALRDSLERGMSNGRAAICAEGMRQRAGIATGRWRVARLGTTPLERAAAARAGRVTDPPADAIHARCETDGEGTPLSGRDRYELRFAPDAPPPVHAFWSLTTTGGAHATGDLRGLALQRDGSLPIFIQHRPPARRRRSNWLPAPPDGFRVDLRLYWPREEALGGRWVPPPVTRVD